MKSLPSLLPALFVASLMIFSACVFYQRYPMAKSRLPKIADRQLTFYLLDAARPHSRVWHISETEFNEDQMKGFLIRLDETEANEIATVSGKRDAKYSKNDVLLYAKPKFAFALADTANVTITYDQLEKIEVYEVNHSKSIAVSLLAALMPMMFLAAMAES